MSRTCGKPNTSAVGRQSGRLGSQPRPAGAQELPQLDLAPELRRRAARRGLLAHDPSVGPAGGLLGEGLAVPGYARTRVKSGPRTTVPRRSLPVFSWEAPGRHHKDAQAVAVERAGCVSGQVARVEGDPSLAAATMAAKTASKSCSLLPK
jgi:hypothetical protein